MGIQQKDTLPKKWNERYHLVCAFYKNPSSAFAHITNISKLRHTEQKQTEETTVEASSSKKSKFGGINPVCRLCGKSIAGGEKHVLEMLRQGTTYYHAECVSKHLEAVFFSLTGNDWQPAKSFVESPHRFDLIKMGLWENETQTRYDLSDLQLALFEAMLPEAASKSNPELPAPIKELIHDIAEFFSNDDTDGEPQGVISEKQLIQAHRLMKELRSMIENEEPSQEQLIEASGRFFTTIPENFLDRSPLQRDPEEIELVAHLGKVQKKQKKKVESDERLLSMTTLGDFNSLLSTGVAAIPKDGAAFLLIQKCVDTTFASYPERERLRVLNVFSVDRKAEAKSFEPFKRILNRKMLWHGSPRSNMTSILNHGFRVGKNPSLYGEAVYFADSPLKAANFCDFQPFPVGFLWLCEVAVGNTYETVDPVKKLPARKDSVMGYGCHQLLNKEMLDGCPLAMGPIKFCVLKEAMLKFNDYAIYNVAQIRIRYLVEVTKSLEH